jgi:hypothetical protein
MKSEPANHHADALDTVAALLRDISRVEDPQAVIRAYASRAQKLLTIDRTVALSRRGLEPRHYRITRSDLWTDPPDPWREPQRLPQFSTGLLGELLYAGRPQRIDRLQFSDSDPAAEHLTGMGSLIALPHFDDGQPLNMVVHMRREPNGFRAEQMPELALLSGLFGRMMKGLVTAQELRRAQANLQEQHAAVSELSDTVIQQAQKLDEYAATLEDRVRQRTAELEEAQLDAVTMLAVATREKDEDTGGHIQRIQRLTRSTAAALGLPPREAEALGRAAILHDVGKLHVPDAILRKPGPLTNEERAVMQQHTLSGERILPDRPFFVAARRIARSHHENVDGSGYPDGRQADAIPLEARIVRIVDVYDALTNRRSYKEAWPADRAREFLVENRGKMFDSDTLAAFLSVLDARPG